MRVVLPKNKMYFGKSVPFSDEDRPPPNPNAYMLYVDNLGYLNLVYKNFKPNFSLDNEGNLIYTHEGVGPAPEFTLHEDGTLTAIGAY